MNRYPNNIVFVILLHIFMDQTALAQHPVLNKVDFPEGVSGGYVGNFGQDAQGYLWLGTRFGLHRYDGYKYESYYHDPEDRNSLAENRIISLVVAKNGLIWLGLWSNGIDCFDPSTNTFTHFLHDPDDPTSLSNNNIVHELLEDQNGTIWAGTSGGLNRFHPGDSSFTRYQNIPGDPTSLSCDQVRALYEDRQGNIWVGTGSPFPGESGPDDGGLNRFDRETGTFTQFMHDPEDPRSLLDNKVGAILEDSRGTFWVGTKGDGLHTMDRETGTFTRHHYDSLQPHKLSRAPNISRNNVETVSMLHEDNSGAIWIGTLRSGLSRYDPIKEKIMHYTYKPGNPIGLESNYIRSAFTTKEGELWISTFALGKGYYYRVDPSPSEFNYHHIGNIVWGIVEDLEGNIWIGTNKGLQIYSSGDRRADLEQRLHAKLKAAPIESLIQDRNGEIWIGLKSELLRLNPDSWEIISFVHDPNDPSSLGKGDIFPLLEDSNGILWIGSSDQGLNRLDQEKGTFIHYQYDSADLNSISTNSVAAICEDRMGGLWVGGINHSGVSRLDKKTDKFKRYLTRSPTGYVSPQTQRPSIFSIMEDSRGKIWAGGGESFGLYYYDPEIDDFVNYKDQITSKQITEQLNVIQEDGEGNIWIVELSGRLHKLDTEGRFLATYGTESGVGKRVTEIAVSYIDGIGNIYYGDTEGYYKFDPSKIKSNPNPPIISFSELRLFGEVVAAEPKGLLKLPVDQSETIELAHDQNVFSLGYTAIHFTNPEGNRMLYMLENHDRDWIKADVVHTASYFDLLPGEYLFRLKAANSNGVWAERQLLFVIHPPWWLTWWAYAMYGVIFIVGVFAVDRFQRRRLLARERERTREKELKQAKEIKKAYDQLEVAHSDLKSAQSQLIQSEKMASLGELTAGIAHEIQNPLNFVNNFSEVNDELIEDLQEAVTNNDQKEIEAILKDLKDNESKIKHHGNRADSIVKGMLMHSRTSQGEKEPTDINALADEYLRLAYHGMRAKDKSFNADFKTDFDLNLPKINVVPQDIGRVLLNLINNAFYAVNENNKTLRSAQSDESNDYKPEVIVSTSLSPSGGGKGEDKIEISVKDNGPGIPEQVREKIFQPFFTTKPTGSGTGLGLSLSYDIVKAHGGEIKIESKVGKGSAFVVSMPIV